MADEELVFLPAVTLPLTGTELMYFVQGGNSRQGQSGIFWFRSDVDNDTTLAADSPIRVPTQHATKTYIDTLTPFYLARANHTGVQAIATVTGLQASLDSKAPLASPIFTGNPQAPTPAPGDNDTSVANTSFVNTAVASGIAANDAMVFKGVINASTNPNYPAADTGWTYRISVAGKIGGAAGPNVEVGDLIVALVDGSPAGTQAAVGANWTIVQTNLDGAVIGPTLAGDSQFAAFDGVSGKLIKAFTTAQATAALNAFVGDSGAGGTKGLVPAPAAGDAAANKYLRANGTWSAEVGDVAGPGAAVTSGNPVIWNGVSGKAVTQITYTGFTANLINFIGDSGAGGVKGVVPAPAPGDGAAGRFLRADGTWDIPSGAGIAMSTTTQVLTGTDTVTAVTPDALAALWEKGANVASAATVTLGEGGAFHITGAVTITDIDWTVAKDGRVAILYFDGAPLITHSANLVLQNAQNIQARAGDIGIFQQDVGDKVVCIDFIRAIPGLVDNTTGANRALLGDTVLAFGSTTASSNYVLGRPIDTGSLQINGGDSTGGGDIRLFGGNHPSQASDIEFQGSGGLVYQWDNSAVAHKFIGLVDLSTTGSGQVKFPSTQNPSADANTFDDYAEGTWSPIYVSSSGAYGAITYNASRGGSYTKIGDRVLYDFVISTDVVNLGTASGQLCVRGMPYTVGRTSSMVVGFVSAWAVNAPWMGVTSAGTSGVVLYHKTAITANSAATQSATDPQLGSVSAANNLHGSGHFRVA